MSKAWIYSDGGREAAGYRGKVGDCVVRAIAIATEQSYQTVYDAIYSLSTIKVKTANGHHYSYGVKREVWQEYLESIGWIWTPTMRVGSGCRVHLNGSELPPGRIIARCSRHLVAVIDGVIHDTFDPSRGGSRCVYGYWSKP